MHIMRRILGMMYDRINRLKRMPYQCRLSLVLFLLKTSLHQSKCFRLYWKYSLFALTLTSFLSGRIQAVNFPPYTQPVSNPIACSYCCKPLSASWPKNTVCGPSQRRAHGQLLKNLDVTVPSGNILLIFIIKRGFCFANLIPLTKPAWTKSAFNWELFMNQGKLYIHFRSAVLRADAT